MLQVRWRLTLCAALFLSIGFPAILQAGIVLIENNAKWLYLDDGSDQGSAWTEVLFDDDDWGEGPAQLGYGDNDEDTELDFGGVESDKYITIYFRKHFTLNSTANIGALRLSLLRDDGAVVYLNGSEIWRSNMPLGEVTATTLASSTVSGSSEDTFYDAGVSAAGLVVGDNVLAVEIHQRSASSSDISFALSMETIDAFAITRGPYLQLATPSSQLIQWRTPISGSGKVRYGVAPGNLNLQAVEVLPDTNHVVTLSGLTPATTYYYEVLTNDTAVTGNGVFSFTTPPLAGSVGPHRIWVLGDSGTADANAAAVRDGFRLFNGNAAPDLWLMLGDNAYDFGTDPEHQAAVFDMYPEELRSSTLWPTLGNHDADSADSLAQSGVYYDIFSLPAAAEAGGYASGTEAYYSFDYGNIHFICLNSEDVPRATNGDMAAWLADDLAVNDKTWTIAFWHHPPYSKGSHSSDSVGQLTDMRQNFLPILEDAGVDLVLAGHSHAYERSFLLDGHYGLSGTLTAEMVLDNGSGDPDTDNAYQKYESSEVPFEGAVYIVAGSSGKISGGALNHPAMYTSQNVLGSVILDVLEGELTVRFIETNGSASDLFAIQKHYIAEYTVGGNVSGLSGGGLVLQNNATDDLPVSDNEDFVFATPLDNGADYEVTVLTQPSSPNQNCDVTFGSGKVSGGNVSGVAVNCTTATYTIGGSVAGLSGVGLVLQNNLGDDLVVTTNDDFLFATALEDGSSYKVTVLSQPQNPRQVCVVTNGSGVLSGENAIAMTLDCVDQLEEVFKDGFEGLVFSAKLQRWTYVMMASDAIGFPQ